MSDLYVPKGYTMVYDDGEASTYFPTYTKASPVDLLAAVRRGVESGTIKGKIEDCATCYGDGAVPEEAPRGSGLDCMAVPCPTCGGTGRLLRIPVSDVGEDR